VNIDAKSISQHGVKSGDTFFFLKEKSGDTRTQSIIYLHSLIYDIKM